MSFANTPIDAPAAHAVHIEALVAATEDGNMDAVAAITLMLDTGIMPYEWMLEYRVDRYYGMDLVGDETV